MLKAGMDSRRVDKMSDPELPNTAETLEQRTVQYKHFVTTEN
jgi:hypothetical protein